MTLDHETHHALVTLATSKGKDQFTVLKRLKELLSIVKVVEVAQEAQKPVERRTGAQNKALHVGCHLIATALNDAGLDMRKVLKPEIEMPWNKDNVKD